MAIASLTMHRQAKTPQNAKNVADRTTAQKLLANIALQAQLPRRKYWNRQYIG
jgi:hypothetical protein